MEVANASANRYAEIGQVPTGLPIRSTPRPTNVPPLLNGAIAYL
jgi:hypothetical protein